MKNNFYLNKPFCNIFEQPNKLSKKSSQILYGEKFKIISKVNDYFKIKTKYDNYYGYIKIGNFPQKFSSNFKVIVLKSYIYKEPRNSSKTKICLPFSSEINVFDRKSNFLKFGKNQWVKRNDVVKKNIKLKNYVNTFKLFRNCKYMWGGKTFKGIDCSALIQMHYKVNNKFYPRDTIDQIKVKVGKINKLKFTSGNLIYWKGHVAVCINSKNLIHAYGPKRKVLIMPINKTIELIKSTADLKIKKIFSI